jgi:integrase
MDGPKFEVVVQMWKEAKWKTFEESTQLVYERTLNYLEFFEGMKVRAITAQVVDQWLKKMTDPKVVKEQNKSRQTYLHELELLSGIFRYYNEYRDDSQFVFPIKRRHREAAIVRIVRGKKKKPMTPEQFELWTEALRAQGNGLMKETIARTQRSGALRISEVAAIHWEDIDWDNRTINVHGSVMWPRCDGRGPEIKEGFKNGDEKIIPISPDAYRLLRALFDQRTGILVFNENERPLEYRYIQHAYDCASRKAKIDFSGTHVMRRTGASWILNQTGDIDLAKELG